MAEPARRIARAILDEQTITNLIAFADDLEARAAALEAAVQTFTHRDAVVVHQGNDGRGQH
jgi:hypothetical protein